MSALWTEVDWPAPKGVRALSTCRGGIGNGGESHGPYAEFNLGDHVGDVADAVAENRRRLRAWAGLPDEPAWLNQVHGTTVVDLDQPGPRGPADGAAAVGRGKVCAILTADCLPVIFTTDTGDRVAAAHAGWRGLAAGIIEATVKALNTPARHLLAWLGPAIGPQHFEVGAEVREAFVAVDPGSATAFVPNAQGRFLADLYGLARRRLENLGLSRIYGGGECTFSRPDRYYSYRRDGVTGRQATLIWREGL
jgi:YfiH family protein